MKVKVKIKKKTNRLLLTEKLIIYKRVELSSIPQNIRINNPSLYVTAFRLAREKSSIDCYINALNILHSDINACKSNNQKAYLEKLFNNYLELNTFQNINIALPKYTSPYKETIKNLAASKSSQIIFVDSKNDCNYRWQTKMWIVKLRYKDIYERGQKYDYTGNEHKHYKHEWTDREENE